MGCNLKSRAFSDVCDVTKSACCLLHFGFFPGLLFAPEHSSHMFLRNVRLSPNYRVLQPRTPYSSPLILPTHCICEFHVIITINNDYFPRNNFVSVGLREDNALMNIIYVYFIIPVLRSILNLSLPINLKLYMFFSASPIKLTFKFIIRSMRVKFPANIFFYLFF